MKKFLPIIVSVLIIVLGIVFVVSGIHTLATKDLYDSSVTATVVDVEEYWDNSDPENSQLVTTCYIDYEVNGVKYEHVESPVSDGNMEIGDTVEILYQSQNPEKISAPNITSGGIIFIVVGVVAAVGGCISAIRAFVRRR